MTIPKVSIVILNWNGYEDTAECLESLRKIRYRNYEIIVIDNGSNGDDVKLFNEKYSDSIHLIANDKNVGFPEGVNIGIRYALKADTSYLLLLNNDVIVDADFLDEMINIAESDDKIGIVGSKIYYYNFPNIIQAAGGKINWYLGYIKLYGDGQEDRGQFDQISERDYVHGTSLLLKTKVIEQVGYFDSFYFFGVEEYDYCTRVKRAGFKIMYSPKSKVWHKLGASRAKLSQYPETKALIDNERGFNYYKFYYRFFKTYCPPVLFIFPFFICTVLRPGIIARFFYIVKIGDWATMRNALLRVMKGIFNNSDLQ